MSMSRAEIQRNYRSRRRKRVASMYRAESLIRLLAVKIGADMVINMDSPDWIERVMHHTLTHFEVTLQQRDNAMAKVRELSRPTR